MKNWKTTIFGVLAAAAFYLSNSTTGIVQEVSKIIATVATALGFCNAADAQKKN